MPANTRDEIPQQSELSNSDLKDWPESKTDAEISPQNQEVLLQIASLIRLSEGFRLGFVKCNQPIQCHQLAARLREMLAGEVEIAEIDLKSPVKSLRLAVLESLKKPAKAVKQAVFVFGFEESIPSEGPVTALEELNLSRDLFPEYFPSPLLIWLPDYALTRLAREAPDFWGWRSGVFEFSFELRQVNAIEKTISQDDGVADNLSLDKKMDRAAALEGLIRDYYEMERGERENLALASLLHKFGLIYLQTGNYEEARKLYQESLEIYRNLGDKSGVSRSLHQLGILAQYTGNYDEAGTLYQESLKIFQELEDKSSISRSLHELGILAQDIGNYEEARKLYQKSLKIFQELGDKGGVSVSLHNLGTLAQHNGNYDEARTLYQESLKIFQELGDKSGVSVSLHQLGMLAQYDGNYSEAHRLYHYSLKIAQDIGDKRGIASSLVQLALLEESQENIETALDLITQAEAIFREIGLSQPAEKARAQRERLEREAQAK